MASSSCKCGASPAPKGHAYASEDIPTLQHYENELQKKISSLFLIHSHRRALAYAVHRRAHGRLLRIQVQVQSITYILFTQYTGLTAFKSHLPPHSGTRSLSF